MTIDILSFTGNAQRRAISAGLRGEERDYFMGIVKQINATVATMPKTYEQDGKGDQAIAYLHYFTGGCDWYITERDMEDEQHQAFGLADLFRDGGELGYISIVELLQHGAELDFHFTPKTLAELKAERGVTA
jgi:hypothetical protein